MKSVKIAVYMNRFGTEKKEEVYGEQRQVLEEDWDPQLLVYGATVQFSHCSALSVHQMTSKT